MEVTKKNPILQERTRLLHLIEVDTSLSPIEREKCRNLIFQILNDIDNPYMGLSKADLMKIITTHGHPPYGPFDFMPPRGTPPLKKKEPEENEDMPMYW